MYIKSPQGVTISAIKLYATTGQLIKTESAVANNFSLEGLAKGVYVLKLISSQGVVTKMISKE